jgi:hypothetical protein
VKKGRRENEVTGEERRKTVNVWALGGFLQNDERGDFMHCVTSSKGST